MKLTNEQITQLKQKGLDDQTIADLASKNGYEMPSNESTLSKITKGVNSVFAGGKVGEVIGTGAGYAYNKIKDTIQGTNNAEFYDRSLPSPLQVAGDVALGATQVAGAKLPIAQSVLGKTAQFGTLGLASGASKAISEGKSAKEVAQEGISEGLRSALLGFTFGVAEKGLQKGAEILNKTGERIQAKVIVPTKPDIDDGFKIETLKKYDLGGSLKQTFEKTNTKMEQLSTELNKKLATNNTAINLNSVFERTKQRLGGTKLETFGTNSQMEGAINRLKLEIEQAVGKNGLASIPESQVIKRASGHLGAWNYGNTAPEAKASEKVFNAFYTELKNEIEKASPEGVREINKQLSEMIPVLNAVIRRMPIAERNSIVGLPEMLSLVGATVEPRALAITGLNLAQKSGRVGNLLANVKGLGKGIVEGAEQITQSTITR